MPDYFDLIPDGSPVDAAVINAPLLQLNDNFALFLAGQLAQTGWNVGNATTVPLSIVGGAVTKTRLIHTIDTEGDIAEDDLTQINGGVLGQILIIRCENAARTVVVRHGQGNIDLAGGIDKRLDSIRKTLMMYYDGAMWCEFNGMYTRALKYNSLRVPDKVPVRVSPVGRNSWGGKASAAALVVDGMAAPTVTGGAATASNDTDSTYQNYATGAVSGNPNGIVSATFNLVRRSHNPIFSTVVRIMNILAIRVLIGLTSAALTNADTVAGATEFVGYRFSTLAGDSAWMPLTKDATTQTTGGGMDAVAVGRWLLQIELDDANSRAIFTINNGTPVVIQSNLPASATDLGFEINIWTVENLAKNIKISRYFCEYD